MTNFFHLHPQPSPYQLYQQDLQHHNWQTFTTRFLAYLQEYRNLFNSQSLARPAGELLADLLHHTFLLDLELPPEYKNKSGRLITDHQNNLVVQINGQNFPVLLNQKNINIENLHGSIIEQSGGVLNSNFAELFMEFYTQRVKEFCLNRLFSRYQKLSPWGYLRNITKAKWITVRNDLRWAIRELEQDIGITLTKFINNSGQEFIALAPVAKLIHCSFHGPVKATQPWLQTFPEEENLFIQGGDSGIVFDSQGNYLTAFVEVFPKKLNNGPVLFSSFIRGEGSTMAAAEAQAFALLQKAKACLGHQWDPRNRNDGCGFCSQCGVFNSNAFPHLKK